MRQAGEIAQINQVNRRARHLGQTEDSTRTNWKSKFLPNCRFAPISPLHITGNCSNPVQSCVKTFRESPSKMFAAHPKNAPRHNFSASHSQNLAGMFLHFSVDRKCIECVCETRHSDLTYCDGCNVHLEMSGQNPIPNALPKSQMCHAWGNSEPGRKEGSK